MANPIPPVQAQIADKPLPKIWLDYFKALEAHIKALEARLAALEGP